MNYSRDQVLDYYRRMSDIREFEETIHRENLTGEIPGFSGTVFHKDILQMAGGMGHTGLLVVDGCSTANQGIAVQSRMVERIINIFRNTKGVGAEISNLYPILS